MDSSENRESQEIEWIKSTQQGDREAFARLVERYQQRVFSLVFRLVHRPNEVEDIVQEIFIKVFRTIGGYNFRAAFGTWVNRIAVNHCYDYLRRVRASRVSYYGQMAEESRRQFEAGLSSPEAKEPSPERQAELRDLVSKLLERAPADDRIILVLKELEDHSVEDIAEILKLKGSTVKVRLHRARKRMLEDLRRWQGGW